MSAIAPEAPTDTDLDLGDLDMLDDDVAHAVCARCYPPEDEPFGKMVGICGTEFSDLAPMTDKPCIKCLLLAQILHRCPKCGWEGA